MPVQAADIVREVVSAEFPQPNQLWRKALFACVIARDCAGSLRHTINVLAAVGAYFGDFRICIYENDSVDGTGDVALESSLMSHRIQVRTEVCNTKKWGMVRDPNRGLDYACYRNAVREMAREELLSGMFPLKDSIAMVCDADINAEWACAGLMDSFNRIARGEADVYCSQGLRWDGDRYHQCDAWAFREHDWKPMSFQQVKDKVYIFDNEPVRLKSGFGGLAVYSGEAFFSPAQYAGGDCEHVTFHRSLAQHGFDRLYLNPAQVCVYRWKPNK